jgi:hypothetical protein
MGLLLDSFWRAVAYCLHPARHHAVAAAAAGDGRAGAGAGLAVLGRAVDAVFRWLESSSFIGQLGGWLPGFGSGSLRTVVAPLVVIALATPVIVLGVLLVVAAFMTPAMVRLVGERRFPAARAAPRRVAHGQRAVVAGLDAAGGGAAGAVACRCGSSRPWCWCCRR